MVFLDQPTSFQSTSDRFTSGQKPTTALSGNAETSAVTRASNETAASNGERVSISSRAERMARISAEYFSGAIASDRIPELTQRLYEDGFIQNRDVQQLLGADKSTSVVADAQNAVFRFLDDNPATDVATTRSLLQVLSVIRSMDDEPTPQSLMDERQATVFMQAFINEKKEAGREDALPQGFNTVNEVLQALEAIRSTSNSAKSPTDLYTQVQSNSGSSRNDNQG